MHTRKPIVKWGSRDVSIDEVHPICELAIGVITVRRTFFKKNGLFMVHT